jgi:hypothetical protein
MGSRPAHDFLPPQAPLGVRMFNDGCMDYWMKLFWMICIGALMSIVLRKKSGLVYATQRVGPQNKFIPII